MIRIVLLNKLINKIIVVFLLLYSSNYGYSQVVTIKDSKTDEPLEAVWLTSEKTRASLTTDAQGQADISCFKDADKIELFIIGYKPLVINYNEIEKLSYVIHLSASNINLDEIVISATRWNQKASDIPSKIVSISSKEVNLQNPQTAADLLSLSGKVFIQKSQQGGGSPMIRGFATNRLLYSVDGVRMNTAIFRAGNIQNVISLDQFATENAEVFFGPGSVIYGSDAIGGVMSFQTLSPQLSLTKNPLITGKAVTRYSTANNEKTDHFDVGVGWKKFALITSISHNNYGDLRMGNNGPDEYLRPFYVERQNNIDVIVTNDDPLVQAPSGYSQTNMMQKLKFKPNDKWDIQYGFHYSETSDYSRYDRHIRYKNNLPRYGEWKYGPQKWMMNNLTLTHNGKNVAYDKLTVRLAQQYFEESRISRDFNKPNREIRIEEVDAYSSNFDFNKSINAKNTLLYGFETVYNDINSIGINEDISTQEKVTGPSRYPQSTWASYAVYITDQYKATDKFSVQSGLRYNHFILDAKFDTTFYPFPFTKANLNNGAINGSFGFVYRPTDKWVISSNVASAFRSPNVDDLGKVFDSEAGSVTVPNPQLKAENAYNIDLGIARLVGDIAKLDITGYYTLLQNAMVCRNYTLNGLDSIMYDGELSRVKAVQNAASAYVYGVQAGLTIKILPEWNFSSDFNFQKGEEELENGTKSPLRHAPPWHGVSRLTYLANKLEMQFYIVYCGAKSYKNLPEEEKGKPEIYAKDANGNPWSPKWYTLNFKATYKFTDNLSVSAGLENITDQRYRPYSSGIVAPGRNFILSLKANF